MTQWTDDHLVDLLHDSFAAHEANADPDRAREIALAAAPERRRPWLGAIAAAAVLVLVAGGLFLLLPRHRTAPPPMPAVPIPSPTQVGRNRAVAKQAAQRMLDRVPLPPGAVRTREAPASDLHGLNAHINAVDLSLSPHRWYVVPMSYGDLVTWYAEHTEADAASTGWPTPVEHELMDWSAGPATAAYTDPSYVVSYTRLSDNSTGLRVAVSLAARYDRTRATLAPISRLTSITVRQTSFTNPPDRASATIDDPRWLRSIATAFNATRGAPAHDLGGPCGSPTGDFRLYAATLRWPGHVLEVGFGQPLCGVGRELILDGHTLPQQLEDGAALNRVLRAALRS